MRTLTYEVKGQRLVPVGNHNGIVAGTKGYLKAKFICDNDWKGCKLAASFFVNGVEEYAVLLEADDSCMIPEEALTGSFFEVSLEGRRDNYKITSRRVRERQIGGVK